MKSDLRGERRGGFYWSGNPPKPYVSVTNALSVIRKPAIEYWKQKMTYLAAVKDPSISLQAAMAAPYEKSKKSKSRGTTVHDMIAAYQNGAKIEPTDEFRGYYNAFKEWISDHSPKAKEVEKTVFSEQEKYAGTLDMLANIGGKPHVVDFKTSKNGKVYMESELQVSAYCSALQEAGIEVNDAVVVGLGEDGSYTHRVVERIGENQIAFLAVQRLWYFLNREVCEKLGYKMGGVNNE